MDTKEQAIVAAIGGALGAGAIMAIMAAKMVMTNRIILPKEEAEARAMTIVAYRAREARAERQAQAADSRAREWVAERQAEERAAQALLNPTE
jgi:hypothetical protein